MTQEGVYKRKTDSASSQQGNRYVGKVAKGSHHVYYPQEYFKRVGYQPSESDSVVTRDALGQRVRERFNEQIDYTDAV